MLLEMVFGHKQFFECDARVYARFQFQFVREGRTNDRKGEYAEKKCYANTLRSYCVSTIEGESMAMEDCVESVMMVGGWRGK